MRTLALVVLLVACGKSESKKQDPQFLMPLLTELSLLKMKLATATDPNVALATVIVIARKVDEFALPESPLACRGDAAAALDTLRTTLAPFKAEQPASHVRNAELRGIWQQQSKTVDGAICELQRSYKRCLEEAGSTATIAPAILGC